MEAASPGESGTAALPDTIPSEDDDVAFLRDPDVWGDAEERLAAVSTDWSGEVNALCRFRIRNEDTARCLGLMQVLLERKESASSRAFRLAEMVISCNDGHYSAWQVRRNFLAAAAPHPRRLKLELRFTRSVCASAPKSYQAWHHRRWVVSQGLGAAAAAAEAAPHDLLDAELDACEYQLEGDAKNMCAWAHRDFLLRELSGRALVPRAAEPIDLAATLPAGIAAVLLEGPAEPALRLNVAELAFLEQMLALDEGNNSAWAARFAAFSRVRASLESCQPPLWTTCIADAFRDREIARIKSAIAASAANAAAWGALKAHFPLVFARSKRTRENATAKVAELENLLTSLERECGGTISTNRFFLTYSFLCKRSSDDAKEQDVAFADINKLRSVDPMRCNFYDLLAATGGQNCTQ